ncbi:hypothetical protein CIY_27150 [Butyrivibrio fibrisolvens 16/4]|nr:hypothetical protein CIY_27150 [Butyrivibrio fibrisolvens 16/4]
MNDNFWIIDSEKKALKYTENIYTIMNEQVEYLKNSTNGKVFAVFGEITTDGSLINIAKSMSEVFRNAKYMSMVEEKVGDITTSKLIDISSAYQERRMGFEICTNNYRYRLFELKMTPVYPVIIVVDEDIICNIGDKIDLFYESEEKNTIIINDEDEFCAILKRILQAPKVIYLVKELMERVEIEVNSSKQSHDKIVICEGRTDAIILQAIAKKLGREISIIPADGKGYIPNIYKKMKDESSVLIVVDSDGDEKLTRQMFSEQIGAANYKIAIINNRIEDWFAPKLDGFSKLEILQKVSNWLKRLILMNYQRSINLLLRLLIL